MGTFAVQMPDGSTKQVQGTTLSAAVNNAGAGATAPGSGGGSSNSGGGGGGGSSAPAAGTYNTVTGIQTTATMAQQLQAAGWGGNTSDPSAVAAAYASTAVGPTGQHGAVTPSSNPAPTPSTPGSPGTTASPADLAGIAAEAQAASGLSIKELDEKKREFDASLAWQQQLWQNQGLPQLAIQQRAQDLADKQFAQLQSQAVFSQNLQTAQQALAEKVQLGQLSVAQAQQALADKIQSGQLAVSQGQLGLDTLKTAASLSGPANFIQASNFNRGVAANAQLPGFVSQLLNTGRITPITGPAPGAQMSAPLSLGSIAGQQGVVATPSGAAPAPAPAAAPAASTVLAQPQGQQAGYWSMGASGQMYFTPTAPAAQAADTGAGTGTALDPSHMASFYAQAVQAANTGGSTGTAAPAASSATQYATPADVSAAFGRTDTSGTAQQNQTDAAAAGLQKIYAQGGQALGPQALESLTPTESQMFQGGGAAIGADVPGYLSAYQQSRIGQSAAKPTTAAA